MKFSEMRSYLHVWKQNFEKRCLEKYPIVERGELAPFNGCSAPRIWRLLITFFGNFESECILWKSWHHFSEEKTPYHKGNCQHWRRYFDKSLQKMGNRLGYELWEGLVILGAILIEKEPLLLQLRDMPEQPICIKKPLELQLSTFRLILHQHSV